MDDELAEFQKEAESLKELSDDGETAPIVPTEEDTGGRPDNGCFDFDPDHTVCNSLSTAAIEAKDSPSDTSSAQKSFVQT